MLAKSWQNLKFENIQAVNTRGFSIAWEALVKQALEPAGFNSPELLFPILKRTQNANLATVSDGEHLLFALPLQKKQFFNENVSSPLLASALPHISKIAPAPIFESFLNGQTKPILLRGVPSDGPFFETLKGHSSHFEIIETWQRAALMPQGKFEKWLQTNFDQKRRKEFKRLRNRLAEQGELSIRVLGGKDTTTQFVDDFLTLEAGGWKGKRGTAISVDPKLKDALHEAAVALHSAKKLRFWSLQLNGRAIASLFAVVEGPHAWLGKIAYDEAYAKYSPGVMIILDCTESFFLEKSITQVDSSAIPNHPMIDRIWRDRLPMASVMIAPSRVSEKQFKMIVGGEKLRLKARAYIRDLYYKLKGVKRS
jgi:CelD/BcsL family acetyltransferase involved in cellulose biosynthesis